MKQLIKPLVIIGLVLIFTEMFAYADELDQVFNNLEEKASMVLKGIFGIAFMIAAGAFAFSVHSGMSRVVGLVIGVILFACISTILNILYGIAG